ncbi:hypothetical protein HDE_04073 [Halotydeus destructor]|nr:hypothetical protein HDE_04073 [Halotydeus destructor]
MLVKTFFLAALVVANAQDLSQDWGDQSSATHVLSSAMLPESNYANEQFDNNQFIQNTPEQFITPETPLLQDTYTPSLPVMSQQTFNRELPVQNVNYQSSKGGYAKKSPMVQMIQQQKEWVPQQQEIVQMPVQQQELPIVEQKVQMPLVQEKFEMPIQQQVQLPVQQEKFELPAQQQELTQIEEKYELPVQQQVQLPVMEEKFVQPIQQQEQLPIQEKIELPVQQQVQEKFYEQAPLTQQKFESSDYSQQYETSASNVHATAARALNLAASSEGIVEQPLDINFSCLGKSYGYYADIENNCQLYHICYQVLNTRLNTWETTRASFYCPTGTIFDQEKHICVDRAMALPCSEAYKYIAHTVSRFSAPTTWGNYGQESSRSSVYANKGSAPISQQQTIDFPAEESVRAPAYVSKTSYTPLESVRHEGVKGRSMQTRSVEGKTRFSAPIAAPVKGLPARSFVQESIAAPVKGLPARSFVQESIAAPVKGLPARSFAQESISAPVKGLPARSFVQEPVVSKTVQKSYDSSSIKGAAPVQSRFVAAETKGLPSRTLFAEAPTKTSQQVIVEPARKMPSRTILPATKGTRSYVAEVAPIKGSTKTIDPIKGQTRHFVAPVLSQAKGGNLRASVPEYSSGLKGGNLRASVPEYVSGTKSAPKIVQGELKTVEKNFDYEAKTLSSAPARAMNTQWSASAPAINMMDSASNQFRSQLPLSPAMRLGLQKNA